MNKTSFAITVLAIVAATAIGLYGFVATQSAAAQFGTSNTSTQSATQTGTATGGAGGSASVSQSINQQSAQTGAFGTSTNTIGPP